jgi:hypothetical protein
VLYCEDFNKLFIDSGVFWIYCIVSAFPVSACWVIWCPLIRIDLYEPYVLYIRRAHRYSPNTRFYVFFQHIYVLNFFKHTAHPIFFSSKCRLFHNATFFGYCIIRILHTGCTKNLSAKFRCHNHWTTERSFMKLGAEVTSNESAYSSCGCLRFS